MSFFIFFKKSQFSVIEVIFLVLLFSTIGYYIYSDFEISEKSYYLTLESGLDSIYYSEDYRQIILDEDLTVSNLVENWDNLNQTLKKMFNNYELIILDEFNSKKIFTCQEVSRKLFDERVIFVDSGDKVKFRMIRLGVCY